MSEATQTQTLEETLNRTDLGHVIYENRKALLGVLLAIFLGILGYVIWQQMQESKSLDNSVKVFEFQTKTWAEAKSGKLAPEQLVAAFKELDSGTKKAAVMVPVGLEMGKFLYEKGQLKEADEILSNLGADAHHVSAFFVGMQRAVVLEKMGNLDEAITILEKLAKSQTPLMPARVSLELGRLYLQKGSADEARTQFDHVINTYPNDEAAKLARLYLSKISQ